jgi:hypothetical protein
MGLFSFIDKRFKKKHTEFNHKKFIIPVDGITREEAKEQVHELMRKYHEDVQWDDSLGEVKINGDANLPFTYEVINVNDIKNTSKELIINGNIKIPFKKEYWFPINSLKNSQ